MEEMSDIRPEELAGIIQAALTGRVPGVRLGRIAGGGRDAGFDMKLPNGQVFRLQLEEL